MLLFLSPFHLFRATISIYLAENYLRTHRIRLMHLLYLGRMEEWPKMLFHNFFTFHNLTFSHKISTRFLLYHFQILFLHTKQRKPGEQRLFEYLYFYCTVSPG
jgi:hypothetical protein